jgi:hypothetical protein
MALLCCQPQDERTARISNSSEVYVQKVRDRELFYPSMWRTVHLHDRKHFDAASEWNSRRDFESFVHIDSLDQDEATRDLFSLYKGPIGGQRFAARRTGMVSASALTGWVLGAARLQPVVTVIEDLHWLDPSTLRCARNRCAHSIVSPQDEARTG